MRIQNEAYVVFEYSLFLDTGEALPIKEMDQPVGFIVGQGHIMQAIERQLIGMRAGQSASVYLEPHEAFGTYDPDAKGEIPLNRFPKEMPIRPTMTFKAVGPNGPVTFVIQSVQDDCVIVDLNHPLAGRRIVCKFRIHEVRALTQAEKAKLIPKPKIQKNRYGPFISLSLVDEAIPL